MGAEILDAGELFGELVADGDQVVVHGVVLDAFDHLVVAVQAAGEPVPGLSPETAPQVLVQAAVTAMTRKELHASLHLCAGPAAHR